MVVSTRSGVFPLLYSHDLHADKQDRTGRNHEPQTCSNTG